jgi:peptidoglycan/LPS O-acetylase OafA/YrhL
VAIAFVLVLVSEYLAGTRSQYYSLVARAHELLLGAFAAIAVREFPHRIPKCLEIVGIALIVAGFFLIGGSDRYPGVRSLIPTIGTFLILISREESFIGRLLATRGMVFVGLISYPLYLWHWCILALVRYRNIEIDALHATVIVLATFLLSWLT